VLYAEVVRKAPSQDRIGGYATLVKWLVGWVGVDGVPDDQLIGAWMRRIDRMRAHRAI